MTAVLFDLNESLLDQKIYITKTIINYIVLYCIVLL